MCPGIRVDFSEVESFEPLPRGSYPVVVTNVEIRESEKSEYPYLNWELTVQGGEFDNRKLWSITSLSPKAGWKLQEALVAFGEDAKNLDAEFDLVPENYIGVEALAVVEQQSYEGRIQNRVTSLKSRTAPTRPSGSATKTSSSPAKSSRPGTNVKIT